MAKMNFLSSWTLAFVLFSLVFSHPVTELTKRVDSDVPRLVIYYQTTHDDDGNPISMLPLITEQGIALTHLIVCSFHINAGSVIHLNDYPPDVPHFYTVWNETIIMQQAGVKVMGMVGGASPGSFSTQTLDGDDATFEYYYGQLRDVIKQYSLQGMDLDVEQSMSQSGIQRLVSRLYLDFGDEFIITLAPVASAMRDGSNLSGFDYDTLASEAVTATGTSMIDFYNAQFYSGFGTMSSVADFKSLVNHGWDPSLIVAGQLTNPTNGGGYTTISALNQTVISLMAEYGTIGGIMGWEYFNSEPGDEAAPWEWAQEMTEILRPSEYMDLTITTEIAIILTAAYEESTIGNSSADTFSPTGKVDYFSMVNA